LSATAAHRRARIQIRDDRGAPVTGASPRPPRLWPWVLVMVLGIALVPTGIAVFVAKGVTPLFEHSTLVTPATFRQELATGTYYVYEQTLADEPGQALLEPRDVTIRSTSGTYDNEGIPSISDTFQDGGPLYTGQVSFDVTSPGLFTIHVASPHVASSSAMPVRVFVAPSITAAFVRNLGWLGVTGGGGLLFVLGLILLIVRGVQRSRRPTPLTTAPRCANGHPAGPQDRFCHACGTPVYAAAPVGVPQP
jgi:hypothetical protein